jgi:DNA helicase-2/ATP-dependent DNA helicase PcrA
VPYLVRGGERFFDRKEVREALLLLRGAGRAADDDAPAGLADLTADVLRSGLSWDPDRPPAGAGATRERWESLAALHRLAGDLAAAVPTAGLRELVAELEERAAAQHAPSVEGVTLASLHAAKGLEWDAVFLVGLVDGTLPLVHAETPAAVEEERRLLYVGVTRARSVLQLSWALSRSPGGRGSRRPSRFLDGLHAASSRTPAVAGRRGRPAASAPAPVTCRVCGAALSRRSTASSAAAATARPTATSSCSTPCGSGGPSAPRAGPAGVLRVHRRDPHRDRRAAPGSVAALVAIPGIGQTKLDKFGEECCRSSGATATV